MDIESVTVNLTAAQILALGSSPVQLVSAPGARVMLLPMAIVIEYTYGTTPFVPATGDSPTVVWQGTTNSVVACNDPFANTTSSQISVAPARNAVDDVYASFANRALQLRGGNYSGGNGTAKVTLFYLKVSL